MALDPATFDAILRHPLFLVAATGIVSSYVIPRLTRRWQDHQKAIETRTRFATEGTEAIVRFLLSVQLAERRAIQSDKYDAAYQEWEVRRATFASELRGQFQDSVVAAEWVSLSEAVTALYRLSGTFSEPYRSAVLTELRTFFSEPATSWEYLTDHKKAWESNDSFQDYFAAWWKLREAVLQKTGDLARKILTSKTTSFD
jgi:hypothetical protein